MDGITVATTVKEDRLASVRSRSQLFWFLADGLLKGFRTESWSRAREQVPDTTDNPSDPLDSAWLNLVDAMRNLDSDGDRLAVEHTRLLAGLREGEGIPPPFESAWRPGHEAGEITLAVTQAYTAAGFADIDVEAGPQDHLAVELKFMALLALREAEAWRRDDPAAAEARIRQQREFLDRHLIEWVPRWTEGLASQTREPLYWAFTGLLGAALTRTVEDLSG